MRRVLRFSLGVTRKDKFRNDQLTDWKAGCTWSTSHQERPSEEVYTRKTHLDFLHVVRQKVIRGTAAPVDDVFVLTVAALVAPPVGKMEVIVDHRHTVGAVVQHRVKERLKSSTASHYKHVCVYAQHHMLRPSPNHGTLRLLNDDDACAHIKMRASRLCIGALRFSPRVSRQDEFRNEQIVHWKWTGLSKTSGSDSWDGTVIWKVGMRNVSAEMAEDAAAREKKTGMTKEEEVGCWRK